MSSYSAWDALEENFLSSGAIPLSNLEWEVRKFNKNLKLDKYGNLPNPANPKPEPKIWRRYKKSWRPDEGQLSIPMWEMPEMPEEQEK